MRNGRTGFIQSCKALEFHKITKEFISILNKSLPERQETILAKTLNFDRKFKQLSTSNTNLNDHAKVFIGSQDQANGSSSYANLGRNSFYNLLNSSYSAFKLALTCKYCQKYVFFFFFCCKFGPKTLIDQRMLNISAMLVCLLRGHSQ